MRQSLFIVTSLLLASPAFAGCNRGDKQTGVQKAGHQIGCTMPGYCFGEYSNTCPGWRYNSMTVTSCRKPNGSTYYVRQETPYGPCKQI